MTLESPWGGLKHKLLRVEKISWNPSGQSPVLLLINMSICPFTR